MAWKLGIGNLITRAPASATAVGSTADPVYPFSNAGNGYPDEPSRWLFESDGVYGASFDLNLFSPAGDRTDAPSGWRDLLLSLLGTPGLPPDPPEWGTFAARANTLKLYRPSFQDVDVLPGEDHLFECGLYLPAASSATGVKVVVMNLSTGKQWDGAANAWNNDADPLAEQTVDDAWLDVSETLTNESSERVTYRVMLIPVGGAGASFYVYVSDPTLTAEQDFVSLVGHNFPVGSTVTWSDGTVTATLSPITTFSTYQTFAVTPSSRRTWTLSVTYPANTKDWHPSPYFGELWAGRLVDSVCPSYPFDVLEGDLGQIRLEGGLGHETVITESERPNRLFTMKFKATADDYFDARDNFIRACRQGADPIMLAPPDAIEGAGTIWHGRIGPETTYSLINRSRRTFEIKLRESPWPRFRR